MGDRQWLAVQMTSTENPGVAVGSVTTAETPNLDTGRRPRTMRTPDNAPGSNPTATASCLATRTRDRAEELTPFTPTCMLSGGGAEKITGGSHVPDGRK